MITDEIRYDALILCQGTKKEIIEKEIELAQSGFPRFPRDGYCEDDILLHASIEALQYALKYYDQLSEASVDSWQSYFESRREKEGLSL